MSKPCKAVKLLDGTTSLMSVILTDDPLGTGSLRQWFVTFKRGNGKGQDDIIAPLSAVLEINLGESHHG